MMGYTPWDNGFPATRASRIGSSVPQVTFSRFGVCWGGGSGSWVGIKAVAVSPKVKRL